MSPKELLVVRMKSQLIINSGRKMKSTSWLHLNRLTERGVERAELKIKNYFLDREFDMKLI